jgi:DNA repair protein RadC
MKRHIPRPSPLDASSARGTPRRATLAPRPPGPRERLAETGAESLGDADLVALLLGTGQRGEPVAVAAARLLVDLGGLRKLGDATFGALAHRSGIGPSKASRLVAAAELGRRIVAAPLIPGEKLSSSREVDAVFRPRLAPAGVEHFLAVALNAKQRTIGAVRVSTGSLTACPVAPADVYRALLREAAAGVIFVHNHPSGNPQPSPEDMVLTDRLARAGALLGIQVLDHVIIGHEGYFSFADEGLLNATPEAA